MRYRDRTDVGGYDQARSLFRHAGLAFPYIPSSMRHRLRQHSRWVYATRPLGESPYWLDAYVAEASRAPVPAYALLAHAGHGVNSYAIHFYLVTGGLRLFLQIGWGGSYMGPESNVRVRQAFAAARLVTLAAECLGPDRYPPGAALTVVASNFYGSEWAPPGEPLPQTMGDVMAVLAEARAWLEGQA